MRSLSTKNRGLQPGSHPAGSSGSAREMAAESRGAISLERTRRSSSARAGAGAEAGFVGGADTAVVTRLVDPDTPTGTRGGDSSSTIPAATLDAIQRDRDDERTAAALAKAISANARLPWKGLLPQQDRQQQNQWAKPPPGPAISSSSSSSSDNQTANRGMAALLDAGAGGPGAGEARAGARGFGTHDWKPPALHRRRSYGGTTAATEPKVVRRTGSEARSRPELRGANSVPDGVSPTIAAAAAAAAASTVVWPGPLSSPDPPPGGRRDLRDSGLMATRTTASAKVGVKPASASPAKGETAGGKEAGSRWLRQPKMPPKASTNDKPASASEGATKASTAADGGRSFASPVEVELEIPRVPATVTTVTDPEAAGAAAAAAAVAAKKAPLYRRSSSVAAWSAFSAASWCSSSFDGNETHCGAPAATVRSPASYFDTSNP